MQSAHGGLALDSYGGALAIQGKSIDWFSVQKIRDRWWFVTPEGHGMVSLGIMHIFPLEVKYEQFSARLPSTTACRRCCPWR